MSGSKSKMVNCIALLTFKVLIAGTRDNRMLWQWLNLSVFYIIGLLMLIFEVAILGHVGWTD